MSLDNREMIAGLFACILLPYIAMWESITQTQHKTWRGRRPSRVITFLATLSFALQLLMAIAIYVILN